MEVLLISPPWRVWNWASLALGSLKAYLEIKGIPVTAAHLHLPVALEIGLERYEALSSRWGTGDAIFSALLAPVEAPDLLQRQANKLRAENATELADWLEGDACKDIESILDNWLRTIDLSRYKWIGFSVGAMQLTASLYLAQRIRETAPETFIVFGGSGLVGEVAEHLIRAVPYIDVIVNGEGEEASHSLACLTDPKDESLLRQTPNLLYRDLNGEVQSTRRAVIQDLNTLPCPNLDEYFSIVEQAGIVRTGTLIPMEHSRGCQWEHRTHNGRLSGCTFCGLYRNSPNFRAKSPELVAQHIQESSKRYHCLKIGFVDAYLPKAYRRDLLKKIIEIPGDYTLFTETRCDLDDSTSDLMARAGTSGIQLGVESFSTPILAKLEKGARLHENVYSMRLCEEYGLPYQYNLMINIPGVSQHEVLEMLALLPSFFGFRPPHLSDFYLDRNSRVYQEPERFGVDPGSLDREFADFLPARLASIPISQVVSFRPLPESANKTDWEQVEKLVQFWEQRYQSAVTMGFPSGLSYRQGSDFATVVDLRGDEPKVLHLRGMSLEVFLKCRKPTQRWHLLKNLTDSRYAEAAIDALVEHQLILDSDNYLLTLPSHTRLPSGAPISWQTPSRSLD